MPEKQTPKIKRLAREAAKNKRKQIDKSATNIKTSADVESQRFLIGYEYYRTDLCEADNMVHGPLRKLINYYKQVGLSSTPIEVKSIGLKVKNISNKGTYAEYYKGLRDEDTELKELIAGDSARHFFYIDPSKKVVQVIAHVNAHTPLKKQFK